MSDEVRRPFNYRKLFWKWHLYAGWFGGPLVILIAVTGALLVFSPQIDHWLRPDLWHITPPTAGTSAATVSDQTMIDTVRQRYGGERVFSYRQAEHATEPYQFLLLGDQGNGIHDIWVNQYTGQIVGERFRETSFVRICEQLHRRLLTGEFGSSIIELITGWMIVLTITGCFLWWPKTMKALWQGLTLTFRGSAYKVNWRLHNTIGAWTAIFVLLMCLTGMVFSTYSGALYSQVLKRTDTTKNPITNPPKSSPAAGRSPVSVDQLLAVVAKEAPPGTRLQVQLPPTPDASVMMLTLRDERPLWADRNGYQVWAFDQYSGEKLSTFSWAELHPMFQFRMFSISLHYGSIFGLPTKLIALVACLLVPVLSGSGYLIWWWKRKSAQQALARRGEAAVERPARPAVETQPLSKWLIATLIVVGVIFPTIGISYLVLLAWEGVQYLLQTKRTPREPRVPVEV